MLAININQSVCTVISQKQQRGLMHDGIHNGMHNIHSIIHGKVSSNREVNINIPHVMHNNFPSELQELVDLKPADQKFNLALEL